MVGVVVLESYTSAGLARLSRPASAKNFDAGPVEYADVPLPGDRHLACPKNALYLVRNGDDPLAVLLAASERPWQPDLSVEVMAPDRDKAEQFSRRLGRLARDGKAFRGHTLSLEQDCHGRLQVKFHRLPAVARDELILPEALLKRIERHTLAFTRHAEALKAAGRHIKRGLQLYGPPGTGKMLTAMYLVSQMPGRTVLLITGSGVSAIEAACHLARLLAPATVILEDVDLIGTGRNHQTVGANALLFELQPDGRAGRGRRRPVRPHDQPAGRAGAGARRPAGADRPGDRRPPAGRRLPAAAVRPVRPRPAGGGGRLGPASRPERPG